MPGRREHSAVLSARQAEHTGAVALQRIIENQTGMNIPHGVIQRAEVRKHGRNTPKKGKRRKWVRYEREYSNSLWHTDWKLLDDGRWFLCYEDDASRFVTGYGVF